jgi:tetratricopeptide (TPR) repeat protein
VSLWPDECVYQSALGWALYKQPQPQLDAAREHLEQAVELDADDATAHLRLSVLMREMGYTAVADELMARAKMIDPDVK